VSSRREPRRAAIDLLLVSIASTGGWRAAADSLAAALERAGASVARAQAGKPRDVRTFALTDLVQARAARSAALVGIAEHRPRAVVYCSSTAALLWPVPGAIWLDSPAAENRPGRHGLWQRPVERRRLRGAPLLLPMSYRSLEPLHGDHAPAVVVPAPVEPSRDAGVQGEPSSRDIAAITYAGDPAKKRLDVVLEAWTRARRDGERLVVAGIDSLGDVSGAGGKIARGQVAGVEIAGRLPPAEYRALLRRARVFLAAPTREDYGIAPLEALADGCMLVTAPAPGPYPALDLAEQLDPRLVSDDLAEALRIALDTPIHGYAERATALLQPFRSDAVVRTLAARVLPVLLG
jgi:hypothetical protein